MRSDPASSSRERGAHRAGWQTMRRALLLYFALLLVIYLIGAAAMLVLARPSGVNLSDTSTWSDALGYPLNFSSTQTPLWSNAAMGIGLVVGFVLCLLLASRLAPPVPVPVLVAVGLGHAADLPEVVAGSSEDALDALAAEAPTPPDFPAVAPPIAAPVLPQRLEDAPAALASAKFSSVPTSTAVAEPPPVAEQAAQAPSPVKTAIPRVFISHSSANDAFGHTLVEQLRAAGIDAWYDSSGGLVVGDIWWDRIVKELSEREVFVVILSPEALNSDWVRDEIRLAWQQKNGATGKVIVPVLYSACDVPPYVAMVQMLRFDTLPYDDALAQLIDAIREGKTRMLEPEALPSLRLGAPFDETLLPLPPRFIGRREDLAWVEQRLLEGGATGIVTAVRGVGGIGKTALAAVAIRELHWVGRFRDGIAVVVCANMREPREVLRAVLLRFDSQRQMPDDVDLATLGNLAREVLRGRDALVVLDNVEPELDTVAVVTPLREAGATLLLTARHVLPSDAVPAGGTRMLELLSPEDALDLFAEYYRHGTALDLTRPERAAAERIVEALGRHTLAVKLAAATVRDTKRDLDDFAASLGDPRHALDLTESDAPRAVRETFNSSYRTLPEDAQRVFAALAAFATGDVGRKAVEAVAEELDVKSPSTTVDLLVRRALADAAVLDALPEGSDRQRLRLHPLLRAFAQERFAKWAEEQQGGAQLAAAAFYAQYANAMPDAALPPDEANIEGAIEWAHDRGEDELLAELCMILRNFWHDRGRTHEALRYLPWGMTAAERLAAESADSRDRYRTSSLELYYAIMLYQFAGRLEDAARLLLHNREAWRAQENKRDEAVALGCLSQIAQDLGDLEQARRYSTESLKIMREIGDRREEAANLTNLGSIAQNLRDLEEAQRFYEESLAILLEMGDVQGAATLLNNLGSVAWDRGDLESAQRYLEQSLESRRGLGNRPGEGITLSNLGSIARARGDLQGAQHYYEEALVIARETQYAELERMARSNLDAVVAARRAQGEDVGMDDGE